MAGLHHSQAPKLSRQQKQDVAAEVMRKQPSWLKQNPKPVPARAQIDAGKIFKEERAAESQGPDHAPFLLGTLSL